MHYNCPINDVGDDMAKRFLARIIVQTFDQAGGVVETSIDRGFTTLEKSTAYAQETALSLATFKGGTYSVDDHSVGQVYRFRDQTKILSLYDGNILVRY
jgi:hypothetical protein